MIEQRLRFGASFSPFHDAVDFYIGRRDEGVLQLAETLSFIPADGIRHGAAPPTLRLQPSEAQELIDALWSAGLRPTQSKQSQGQFEAQSRHLEDLRAITFAKLKVEKPA